MVTSLVFGETCTVIREVDDWLFVRCDYDGYDGWVPENYLMECKPEYENWTRVLRQQSAFFSNGVSRIHVSAGSFLPDVDELLINGQEFYLTIRDQHVPANPWEQAYGFLYVPYLWGGRSDCGMDCSGLTQIVAKMNNLALPRDASQQEQHGTKVSWEDRKENDLVFFESSGKITHVGLLGKNDKIVHASGRVREDILVKEGIKNTESGEVTHWLASIKRIF